MRVDVRGNALLAAGGYVWELRMIAQMRNFLDKTGGLWADRRQAARLIRGPVRGMRAPDRDAQM